MYQTREYRTRISAPKGKIIAENVVNTVSLEADTVIVLNVEDDVRISAREVLFYGGKLTYDSIIELKQGGTLRFFEKFSIQGLSGDAIIKLEDGERIRLFDLKTRKITSLADEFVPDKERYDKNATLVGGGVYHHIRHACQSVKETIQTQEPLDFSIWFLQELNSLAARNNI